MKGEALGFQPDDDLAVVRTDEGTYSLVELLEGGCRVGDRLSWKGRRPIGWDMAKNLTRRTLVAACLLAHSFSDADVGAVASIPLSRID